MMPMRRYNKIIDKIILKNVFIYKIIPLNEDSSVIKLKVWVREMDAPSLR